MSSRTSLRRTPGASVVQSPIAACPVSPTGAGGPPGEAGATLGAGGSAGCTPPAAGPLRAAGGSASLGGVAGSGVDREHETSAPTALASTRREIDDRMPALYCGCGRPSRNARVSCDQPARPGTCDPPACGICYASPARAPTTTCTTRCLVETSARARLQGTCFRATGSACCRIGCSAHTTIKHGPTDRTALLADRAGP